MHITSLCESLLSLLLLLTMHMKMTMITQRLVSTFVLTLAALLISSAASAGKLGVFTSDDAGFNTHTYYYDDGEEVTIIDTQFVPALTEAMISKIQSETSSPITRVVVTHPNPDKFNGLSVLHKLGASSMASKATADAMQTVHEYKKYYWVKIANAFTEENYPQLEPVNASFEGEQIITLKSGETLTLIELKHAGVSSTQTVVRVDNTGDLIVGDLVHYQAHAWLEGGIVESKAMPDIESWILAVKELPALGSGNIYGGRGQVGTVEQAVSYQTEYLAKAETIVSEYLSSIDTSELGDSSMAQKHYANIQQKFEQAYPDITLSYLIGYGIYGLVNSLVTGQ